jgi:hypothetical protein
MCLSLSLFSVPVSMAVLVQGVSPRVLGVISTLSTSNVCFSLFLIYILDSVLLHGLLPGSSKVLGPPISPKRLGPIVVPKHQYEIITTHCVITQKSTALIF